MIPYSWSWAGGDGGFPKVPRSIATSLFANVSAKMFTFISYVGDMRMHNYVDVFSFFDYVFENLSIFDYVLPGVVQPGAAPGPREAAGTKIS